MVVVVPALAQGDDGQPPVVAGVVAGDVALLPSTCASELMQNVPCQTATVLQKKPTTRPGQPASSQQPTPSRMAIR